MERPWDTTFPCQREGEVKPGLGTSSAETQALRSQHHPTHFAIQHCHLLVSDELQSTAERLQDR